ncbi:MAG TPA: ArsR family transcriptional regulator [Methanosarcinales archaeon]|nr:MAG: ArsR family transcriptional regulator [Methanosarcinales archaeon]HDN66117.1 ArsR family transcriptional regulator [Methanosarcinales archaeon]
MKDLSVKVLDDDDEEFVDILIKQGLKRNTAKVLAYLKGVDTATSKDLEVGSDLRQPEVSIAMRELRAHSWVAETDEKKPGKGRPYKVYSLNIPIGDIILKLSAKKKIEMEEALKNIERLKALSA